MKVRFFYLRDRYKASNDSQNGNPIGCVASTINYDEGTISYNVSMVNPKDKFNKSLAREISVVRLDQRPISVSLPFKEKLNGHELHKILMKNIVLHGPSTSAKKSAQKWLNRFNVSLQGE